MQDSGLTNFGAWVHDNANRCFRYWVYKKIFTPYEVEEKYPDESLFEESTAMHGYIKEAIELPDGDILLGIESWSIDGYLEYYKLSEIRIAYMPSDECDEYPDFNSDVSFV